MEVTSVASSTTSMEASVEASGIFSHGSVHIFHRSFHGNFYGSDGSFHGSYGSFHGSGGTEAFMNFAQKKGVQETVVRRNTQRDIASSIKGKIRPTTEETTSTATSPAAPVTIEAQPMLAHSIVGYDRVNEVLHAILLVPAEKLVPLLVLKHKNETDIRGNGQKVPQESKYCTYNKVIDKVVWVTTERLVNSKVKSGEYSYANFMEKTGALLEAEKTGANISDSCLRIFAGMVSSPNTRTCSS